MTSQQISLKKKVVFTAITALVVLVCLEIGSSWLLLTYYRVNKIDSIWRTEASYLSLVNLAEKVARKAGIVRGEIVDPNGYVYRQETTPDPFFVADPVLGFRAAPGQYIHAYGRKRRGEDGWQYFKSKVTINPDGSRWTGATGGGGRPTIYVFGDSFAFGSGVHDEMSFSALLQQARPDMDVRLVALAGYGLTQAYLIFDRLNKDIKPDDIVILCYADFLDIRHVMAPSRLRQLEWGFGVAQLPIPDFSLPKAALAPGGQLTFSYVNQRCPANGNYCNQPDPPPEEMTAITAALINKIADRSPAKVYLLHYDGKPDNPVFLRLNDRVRRISALTGDFDYFIRDDIMGFDYHPGPYWHYAMSRKVLDSISLPKR